MKLEKKGEGREETLDWREGAMKGEGGCGKDERAGRGVCSWEEALDVVLASDASDPLFLRGLGLVGSPPPGASRRPRPTGGDADVVAARAPPAGGLGLWFPTSGLAAREGPAEICRDCEVERVRTPTCACRICASGC